MKIYRERFGLAATACAVASLLARGALAQSAPSVQTTYVNAPATDPGRVEGWSPGLLLGGTFNLADNRSVVGQVDGTGLSAGFILEGSLDFNKAAHELRTTLAAGAGVTRTPALDTWVKTRDALSFEAIYLYHVVPWFGPFGRFALNTQMFSGTDSRSAPTTYAIARGEGATETITGTSLHLSDPFQPMTLKQSLGVFVQPVNRESVLIEARAGAGAQEVIASGALSLGDDAGTPEVEVSELSGYAQLGAEAVIEASGTLRDKQIAYRAGIAALLPIVYSDLNAGDDRGALDLMNVDIVGGLSFKLVEWASLDYQLHVVRQPQLIDAWQVQNNILLTLSYAVGSKVPAPPPCVPCEVPAKEEPAPAAVPAPAPAPAPEPTPAPAPDAAPAPVPDAAPAPAPDAVPAPDATPAPDAAPAPAPVQ
ncbi:hypothetical protein [Sorangium sp. So ce513]|uniref:hypothetical protein n=1 Tax=Sorangium sp. So ce513 TaxID=3133315 RepID=UPI003F5FDBEA